MAEINAVRGMTDIQPDSSLRWSYFEEVVREVMRTFGYQNIRTPILEKTELFVRSLGEVTDIVEKEMYTFKDQLNNESLTLRPEGTAACVRAAIQHNMTYAGGQRLWYMGPMFRHERPQRGRYRQFHQLGVEALGFNGVESDTEHLLINKRLWDVIGLADITLEINTLGDFESRQKYKIELVKFLSAHLDSIDEHSQKRLKTNPLRILDSKDPVTRETVLSGPKLMDFIGKQSMTQFDKIRKSLDELGVDYKVNEYLVRGLDYYNDLIYEWKTSSLGAQGTVSAGGRYDSLFSQIGGKSTSACGLAVGIERVLELLKNGESGEPNTECDVYVVHEGEIAGKFGLKAAMELREGGLSVIFNYDGGSIKSQMKRANASGSRYAVIIGDNEVELEMLSVKPLRTRDLQEMLPLPDAIKKIKMS